MKEENKKILKVTRNYCIFLIIICLVLAFSEIITKRTIVFPANAFFTITAVLGIIYSNILKVLKSE